LYVRERCRDRVVIQTARHSLDHGSARASISAGNFEAHPSGLRNVTQARAASRCPQASRLAPAAHRSARPSQSRTPDRSVRRRMSNGNAACVCRRAEPRRGNEQGARSRRLARPRRDELQSDGCGLPLRRSLRFPATPRSSRRTRQHCRPPSPQRSSCRTQGAPNWLWSETAGRGRAHRRHSEPQAGSNSWRRARRRPHRSPTVWRPGLNWSTYRSPGQLHYELPLAPGAALHHAAVVP
jgi:hypothetical protein